MERESPLRSLPAANQPVRLLALVTLVALVSIFLGTLIAFTPVLRGLDAETYIRVQQPLTKHVTPIASGLGLISGVALVWIAVAYRRAGQRVPRSIVVAVLCLVGLGISSLLVNVPINSEVQKWSVSAPPSDWASVRDRWDLFHVLRTAMSSIALGCLLLTGTRSAPTAREPKRSS
ncbi:MAG: hypothetical protein QOI95_2080 [Acidimicrobiaceae bacterium]|jgi:uncharacterized membrane protein